ncbi:MAG: hypothetical protein NTZ05_22340 [Chloroflexi bacterium]|nr:hypothetical protein [Chloroflexota bacterium]
MNSVPGGKAAVQGEGVGVEADRLPPQHGLTRRQQRAVFTSKPASGAGRR